MICQYVCFLTFFLVEQDWNSTKTGYAMVGDLCSDDKIGWFDRSGATAAIITMPWQMVVAIQGANVVVQTASRVLDELYREAMNFSVIWHNIIYQTFSATLGRVACMLVYPMERKYSTCLATSNPFSSTLNSFYTEWGYKNMYPKSMTIRIYGRKIQCVVCHPRWANHYALLYTRLNLI